MGPVDRLFHHHHRALGSLQHSHADAAQPRPLPCAPAPGSQNQHIGPARLGNADNDIHGWPFHHLGVHTGYAKSTQPVGQPRQKQLHALGRIGHRRYGPARLRPPGRGPFGIQQSQLSPESERQGRGKIRCPFGCPRTVCRKQNVPDHQRPSLPILSV